MGSDFILRPRDDGQGSDLVIIGVVNNLGGSSESNELGPCGVVALSEVAPPSDETWGRGMKNEVASFLDSQRPGSCERVSNGGGSYPAADLVPESGSGGYPAQTCTKVNDASSEGYLAGAYGLTAANLTSHALTYKPTDPKCDSCRQGKMRNLRKCVGAFSRPVKSFGDIVTIVHGSFYDHGLK